MATFEERFAAAGRAIDGLVDRARRGRGARVYRSTRSRRTLGERAAVWRAGMAERTSVLRPALADWRRGMGSAGTRRLNAVMILGAMVLTAGATWLWTRSHSISLSREEIKALSTLSRTPEGAPAAPSATGAWWNQATTGAAK